MEIVIVTESGSDLPAHYIEQYGIYIVPMHVVMNEVTYDDQLNIQARDVFAHFEHTKTLPTTSGSTPQDFADTFDRIIREHPQAEIVYIAYSSVTTVSYNSARIASENYSNVHLVDSKNVSTGLGTIVLAACEHLRKNPDISAQELVAFVEEIRTRTHFSFLPQTLTYLLAGGRVSNAQYIGAKLLRIFPSIQLENGYLVAGKKHRGGFKKAYLKFIEDFMGRYQLEADTLRLTEVEGLSQDDKAAIEAKIQTYGFTKPEWIKTGAVIACHGGPGAFGISGIEKA
ncbi:EDD domain protein [Suicoccus acidiformans]|uniref:EDD domain protein n=1 Tax=Suicoccus acidiformans TaxID=2036206 RepID=A0A347WJY6_9LACT|nr:DegV family protein [Suicoccus acidiformans]AXY25393.1 EDD domain protein [Suicoccus acidiformans]